MVLVMIVHVVVVDVRGGLVFGLKTRMNYVAALGRCARVLVWGLGK